MPTPSDEDGLIEFADVLALSTLPSEEATAREISIRRAWVAAKSIGIEHPQKKGGKEKADSPDS